MVGRYRIFRIQLCERLTGALIVVGGALLVSAPAAWARGAEPGPVQPQSGSLATGSSDALRPLGVPKPAASRPAAPQPGAIAGDALRTVMSLAGVLALVGFAAFVLKRLARSHGGLLGAAGPGGRAPAGVLEVLGRYPLSRAQTLLLLKLDRRVLLLSQSGGGRLAGGTLSTLCEITDPDEIASILVKVRDEEGDSLARRFQSVLGKADRATADALPDAQPGRRTTINASGDRAELWSQPDPHPRAQGFALLQSDAMATGPKPETGADSLRRRLGSLRRLGDGEGGAGA